METQAISSDTSRLNSHPSGLGTLFFTELWERFSYYGMRAILVLYMISPEAQGGLGFDTERSASIYGTYTMAVYLTALPGGLLADRVIGAARAVLLGGIIIACGHFSMIFHSLFNFYAGMALIACGTGLLKPNISSMVGMLYSQNDPRRDSGFSLFYMGINVGAVLAPLVCGYMAQAESFKRFAVWLGFDAKTTWHLAFGAAGIGMCIGIVCYLANRKHFAHIKPIQLEILNSKESMANSRLTPSEWKRIAAIFIFFVFIMLFWAAYEQKGASLNLFALKLVRTEFLGFRFPSSWLQSLTPLFVIILAPIFSMLWVRMGVRQPSSPAKFSIGLLFIGLAYLLLVPACALTASGKISPLWLIGLYFLEVVGEMCVSPVGLSTVTRLAPPKLVGIMMGVWFLTASFGNKLAGYLSSFFVPDAKTLVKLYGGISVGLLISAGVLALLGPSVKRLMGPVR